MKKWKNLQFQWIFFAYYVLRDIHEQHLSLKDANDEQSNFAANIKNLDKTWKNNWKKVFLNNLGLSFSARENVLNNFKSRKNCIKLQHVNLQQKKQQNELNTRHLSSNWYMNLWMKT